MVWQAAAAVTEVSYCSGANGKAGSMKAPMLVGGLELAEPINDISLPVREDGLACNSVRLQHVPVGNAFLGLDSLDASAMTREILPSGLMAREIGGMFLGPGLYFKGRCNLRRSTR